MVTSPAFAYNDTQFRGWFPAFADDTAYPEPMLLQCFTTAGYYIANNNFGPLYRIGATLWALYLMTAHLAQVMTQAAAGQSGGVVVGATIDKITVTLQQFQFPNQWQLWLSETPYGKQLLAMFQVQSVGGYSIPAGPGRAGFRF